MSKSCTPKQSDENRERQNWYALPSLKKDDASTLGPLTKSELVRLVKIGELGWLDYVISEGESTWRTVGEVDFLLRELQLRAGTRPLHGVGEWIVRRQFHSTSTAEMIGPCTHAEILQRLASGDIAYSDLVWKKGQENWRRLGDCSEFDRRPRATFPQVVPLVVDFGESLLSHVVQSQGQRPRAEVRPDEAVGEDLVGTLPWMKTALAGVALVFLASTARPARAATVLDISPLKLSSEHPILVFSTDAGVSELIQVKLRARTGQILEKVSVSEEAVVTHHEGEIPTLDLTSLKLPMGSYEVDAAIGDLHKQVNVFIGVNDEAFAAHLEEHRKEIAARQQAEKKALYYSVVKMEKLTQSLESGFALHRKNESKWKSFLQGWQKDQNKVQSAIADLRVSPPSEQAYPDQLTSFIALSAGIEKRAEDLDQSVLQKRDVANERSEGAVELQNRWVEMRKQAANLSAQP